MCNALNSCSFAELGRPRRVWSVPAIHGDLAALTAVHDALLERIRPGDRIVYHGNYTGYGVQSADCVDEILAFRRMVLSMRGMSARDLVYLRGQQEQIWQAFLQLPFAPDPLSGLLWMLGNGLSGTLQGYGLCAHDGVEACRAGVMGLIKWIARVREAVRRHPGHEVFSNRQARAAFTVPEGVYPLLFVHAGLDAHKALEAQGDALWWEPDAFERVEAAYKPFEKVVRGYDPKHGGLHLNCVTATVDEACGFGGRLISVGFEPDGAVCEILES